jgi:uncharacterized protein (DUF1810 family)
VFGYPDYLKFHSSVTLFDQVVKGEGTLGLGDLIFSKALEKYFNGISDLETLRLLNSYPSG